MGKDAGVVSGLAKISGPIVKGSRQQEAPVWASVDGVSSVSLGGD